MQNEHLGFSKVLYEKNNNIRGAMSDPKGIFFSLCKCIQVSALRKTTATTSKSL